MNFKKILLPIAAGALTLSLAACGEEDKATKEETPQSETAKEESKAPAEKDQAATEKMQEDLAKQQVDKSEIVAVVNDEKLTGEQYNTTLTSIQGQMQQSGQDPTSKEVAEQLKAQTLDTLVNQTLILQKAKEQKLTASEAEVDERYASFEEQFGGEEGMKEALKAEKMDVATLKTQIAESIVFEKYQDKAVPVKEATEQEIKAYYDQAAAQAKAAKQELPPYEEASKEIKGMLEQQKQQELLTAHVEELKKDAKIELKI